MPYNKKIAIVYKTKYGSTMKYAGWLAIKLNADLYEVSDLKRWDLLKYRTIIFGGPIYNKQIYGLDYILDRFQSISNKNIVIFCVGLNLQSREEIMDYNFKDEDIKKKIKIFFLNGAINYNDLNKFDKVHIRKIVKNKNPRYKNIYNQLETTGIVKLDMMNKKSVDPILKYVKEKTFLIRKLK